MFCLEIECFFLWELGGSGRRSASGTGGVEAKEASARQRDALRVQQRVEAQQLARQAQEMKLQQRMERERALQVTVVALVVVPVRVFAFAPNEKISMGPRIDGCSNRWRRVAGPT